MESILVKIFATALALSQVTTTPDAVKTKFDREADQPQVAQLLSAGCLHMRKAFDIESINLDDLFLTYDMPYRVTTVRLPQYFTEATPALPPSTVLLTIPFAVSGSAQPMLWQATQGMHFRLAGAALTVASTFGAAPSPEQAKHPTEMGLAAPTRRTNRAMKMG